ncbi:MAG: tetratricopeptide repeat protein [Limisphaerales bacterium]
MPGRVGQHLRRHGKWWLLTVSSAFGLLVCEAGVRVMRLAPPVHAIWLADDDSFYRRSTNALLNYEIKPNFSREFEVGRATSNSHGFRDRSRELEKRPGVRRILVLGDSVVEGINYVADHDTVTQHWERLYSGDKTEVLNFGTSGYCTLSEVNLLADKGVAFQPDLVVVVFVYNDYDNFNPEHTIGGGVHERPAWAKHLFVSSELYRWLALRNNWFDFAEEADPTTRNHDAIGDNNVVAGLARLRELANEHQFQVLIAMWPGFGDNIIGDQRERPGEAMVVERLAEMNGLPVVRLSRPFEERWANMNARPNPRLEFTVRGDGMHPNAKGSQIAAELLKELTDQSLPKPPYEMRERDLEAIQLAGRMAAPKSFEAESFEDRAYLALMRQGRAEAAEAFLRGVLKEKPEDREANFHLGRHLFDFGRIEEAVGPLRKTLEIWPENHGARSRLAFALCASKRGEESAAVVTAGLHYESIYLHYVLGAVSVTNGNPTLAAQHLDLVTRLAPDTPGLAELQKQLKSMQ